jgi:arsenate reductase/regulatory protein spx
LQKGVEIVERDIFEEPFTADEIREMVKTSGASEMFNFRSPSFKGLGLRQDELSEDRMIELMSREPRLIKRPVVRIDKKVYFGASEAKLKEILK